MSDAPPPYSYGEKQPFQPPPPAQNPNMMGPAPGPAGNYMPPPVTQTIVVTTQNFGPYSTNTTCAHCQAQIMTETTAVAGLLTWISAGAMLFFGLWCGCCLIPFCTDALQDIEHRCPNCHQFLGLHKRIN